MGRRQRLDREPTIAHGANGCPLTAAGEDISITVSQLRTHMSYFARQVENGQTYTITRSGHPVARLVPKTKDPTIPLFRSDIHDLASRTDEFLEGFGEH